MNGIKRVILYLILLAIPFLALLMPDIEAAQVILAGISTSLVIIVFIESRQNELKTLNVQNYLSISQMFDRITALRLEYPEIAQLAPKWTNATWDLINQKTEEGRLWFQYYGYGEACLNFCMMVHHLHKYEHALSDQIFQKIFNSLLNLVIAENRWYFHSLVQISKFLPEETRYFLAERLKNYSLS